MSAPSKKKGFSIRFDLSIAGLLGVGVVCFCLFLWMFLLGLWAGQSGLIGGVPLPSGKPAAPAAVKPETPGKPAESQEPSPPSPPALEPSAESSAAPVTQAVPAAGVVVPSAPETKTAVTELPAATTPAPLAAPAKETDKEPEPPFYAIQVGAFRTDKNVEDEMRLWRGRGYESFSRPPSGPKENLTKVYIGHYPDAAAAKKELAKLPARKKNPPVVALIK